MRDRVGAQLLLRRGHYDLVILPLDRTEHEAFYHALRGQGAAGTRYIGILGIDGEDEVARLDKMGLDGVVHRPLTGADLKATVNHLLQAGQRAGVS